MHFSLNGGTFNFIRLQSSKLTLTSPDDRPEYASLQAVLFGPFLLAGLTTGDWDAKTGAAAISEWITPVPATYNSQLVTLTQESGGSTLVLSLLSTAKATSLTMQPRPEGGGTDAAVHATFRLVPQGQGTPPTGERRHASNGTATTATLASALIEPFDMPGMAVTNSLTLSAEKDPGSLFNVVTGLDGKPGSVSLELGTRPGCFLVTAGAKANVQVGCSGGGGPGFSPQAASFTRGEPLRWYHPISFAAKGARRSFLLEPLFTLRDEFYTVYFNHGA